MEPQPPSWRAPLAAALATLLFAGALRAFLSGVYNYNLNELGLNATALLPLMLLAPALLRGAGERALPAAALALALARLATPWAPGILGVALSGVACVAALVALAALLPRAGGPALAAGMALGWAADVAVVAWGRSWDWTLPRAGGLFLLPAGALLVVLAWRPGPALPEGPRRRGLAPWGLGAWLFLETAIVANPFGLARWDEVDARLAVLGVAVGLLAGAWLALREWSRAALLVLNALALLFALDHGLLHSPLVPLGALVAQVALVVDAAVVLAPLGSFTAAARAFGLGAGVMVLLQFLLIFAFTFAYVPLSGAWHGLERFLPALAVLLVAAAALVAVPRAAAAWHPTRALAVALAVLLLAAAAPLARPAAPVPAPSAGPMRVMTFNFHQGFDNDGVLDPEVFVRIVRDASPDVVVMQEYDATRLSSGNLDLVRILADRLGYHSYYGPPTSAEGFAGGILSREPIRETAWITLPTTKDNRYATETRLDVGGRDAWLYGVHFGLGAADRAAQLDALLARAATRTGPKLLVGDFNACPALACDDADGGHVYWTLTAAGWRDAWVATGHDANDTAGYTFASFDPTERIDHVWMGPEWDALSVTRVETPDAKAASDHFPVLAELRLR